MESDLTSNCSLIKLKFLIFNDYKIFRTCFREFKISHQKGISRIKKRLAWCVEYSHNGENQKIPPTPIKVNISIYLTLEKISIRDLNISQSVIYVLRNILMSFSTPKNIPQAQNKRHFKQSFFVHR